MYDTGWIARWLIRLADACFLVSSLALVRQGAWELALIPFGLFLLCLAIEVVN